MADGAVLTLCSSERVNAFPITDASFSSKRASGRSPRTYHDEHVWIRNLTRVNEAEVGGFKLDRYLALRAHPRVVVMIQRRNIRLRDVSLRRRSVAAMTQANHPVLSVFGRLPDTPSPRRPALLRSLPQADGSSFHLGRDPGWLRRWTCRPLWGRQQES